jgi:N-acetylglucosaminyldiphosphoundecaprenol N-acetyl-beta-D-mannosaminyltransferase
MSVVSESVSREGDPAHPTTAPENLALESPAPSVPTGDSVRKDTTSLQDSASDNSAPVDIALESPATLEGPAPSGPALVQSATADAVRQNTDSANPVPQGTQPPTCSVLGLPLLVSDYSGAVEIATSHARSAQRPYLIAAANTHLTTLARRDRAFGESMAQFDLILPDGMPLIWVMNRRLPEPLRDRIYGPTFMLHTLEATATGAAQELRHMFVGGTPDLLSRLRERLLSRFPSLQIAGEYAPTFAPWPEGEDERILDAICESGAHFVWVGLGCPRQEHWLARNKHRLPPAVYGAVGAAFAFHAGTVRQAPPWMQRHGMEWLFRLTAEPRRLWKRYFVYNALFLWYLTCDRKTGVFDRPASR